MEERGRSGGGQKRVIRGCWGYRGPRIGGERQAAQGWVEGGGSPWVHGGRRGAQGCVGRGRTPGAWRERRGTQGRRGRGEESRGAGEEVGSPGKASPEDPHWGGGVPRSREPLFSAAPFGNDGLVCHVPSAVREEAAVFLMSWRGSSCLNMVAENYRRRELGCTCPSAYLTQ